MLVQWLHRRKESRENKRIIEDRKDASGRGGKLGCPERRAGGTRLPLTPRDGLSACGGRAEEGHESHGMSKDDYGARQRGTIGFARPLGVLGGLASLAVRHCSDASVSVKGIRLRVSVKCEDR